MNANERLEKFIHDVTRGENVNYATAYRGDDNIVSDLNDDVLEVTGTNEVTITARRLVSDVPEEERDALIEAYVNQIRNIVHPDFSTVEYRLGRTLRSFHGYYDDPRTDLIVTVTFHDEENEMETVTYEYRGVRVEITTSPASKTPSDPDGTRYFVGTATASYDGVEFADAGSIGRDGRESAAATARWIIEFKIDCEIDGVRPDDGTPVPSSFILRANNIVIPNDRVPTPEPAAPVTKIVIVHERDFLGYDVIEEDGVVQIVGAHRYDDWNYAPDNRDVFDDDAVSASEARGRIIERFKSIIDDLLDNDDITGDEYMAYVERYKAARFYHREANEATTVAFLATKYTA